MRRFRLRLFLILLFIVLPFAVFSGAAHLSAVDSADQKTQAPPAAGAIMRRSTATAALLSAHHWSSRLRTCGAASDLQFKLHANGKGGRNYKEFRQLTTNGRIGKRVRVLIEAAP
jgi:hypothetical protein